MGEDVDDRIGKMLDNLQPRVRQRAGYKSNYIALNYDKLERAHRELGYSYKDLAELLTNEGRPTKVPTLKYNMKKLAALRQGQPQRVDRPTTAGQGRRQQARVTEVVQSDSVADKKPDNPNGVVDKTSRKADEGVRQLASPQETPDSPGTIQRFKR